MTIEAVQSLIGNAVVSDEFRQKLMARKMTRKDIAAVSSDLDPQDVNAIVLALMSDSDFPGFSSKMDLYIDRRYPSGAAASADGLPISV